jgi:NAD(P)H-hydrate epimerase
MPGAARLAALAARRVGSGLSTIVANKKVEKKYYSNDPGCLFKPLLNQKSFEEIIGDPRVNTVLVGPGSGVTDETRLRSIISLKMKKSTILDADALTVFQDDPKYLFDLINGPTVLTPHQAEFSRLFDDSVDKLSNCRIAAKLSGAVVLIKGSDTVISAPDGRSVINNNAPPTLATAGSGDVLAGIITGLLTQGMPIFEAVSAGVWLHGEAANLFGLGLIAEDIVDTIPQVLKTL